MKGVMIGWAVFLFFAIGTVLCQENGRCDKGFWRKIDEAAKNQDCAILIAEILGKSRYRGSLWSCAINIECVLKEIRRYPCKGEGRKIRFLPTCAMNDIEIGPKLKEGEVYLLVVELETSVYPMISYAIEEKAIKKEVVKKIEKIVKEKGVYGNGKRFEKHRMLGLYECMGVDASCRERAWLSIVEAIQKTERKDTSIILFQPGSPKDGGVICTVYKEFIFGKAKESVIRKKRIMRLVLDGVDINEISYGVLPYIGVMTKEEENFYVKQIAPLHGFDKKDMEFLRKSFKK
jgi:hypothetical protein